MAGAFTHFILCDIAKRRRSSIGIDLWRLFNKYSEFLFLGAASPDLPYLSFQTGHVNWADVMHHEKTNGVVITGHKALKAVWHSRKPSDEVKFVWLMGYVSHLVTDATIHPIVQATIGPYEQNKEQHRICEMTQDSLIFNEYKNGDIQYAEFSSILEFCGESQHFHELMEFWKTQMIENYHNKNEEPHPPFWFKTYTNAIDLAEGDSEIIALFRHIGIGKNYIYKTKADIATNYKEDYKRFYSEVKLPYGTVSSFKKDGFERAVKNVIDAWNSLYSGLTSDLVVSTVIKNWGLDTGIDMDSPYHEVTYWV